MSPSCHDKHGAPPQYSVTEKITEQQFGIHKPNLGTSLANFPGASTAAQAEALCNTPGTGQLRALQWSLAPEPNI